MTQISSCSFRGNDITLQVSKFKECCWFDTQISEVPIELNHNTILEIFLKTTQILLQLSCVLTILASAA